MNPLIAKNRDNLQQICSKRRVRRLSVFGSVMKAAFNPQTSDIDLLVEFEPMPPTEHAEHYFGLMEDLTEMYGLDVDLVEAGPIQNPYFRQSVEQTRELLFEAA